MRLFTCGHCGQRLYFENVTCTRCGAPLGFLPDRLRLSSLDARGVGSWQPHGAEASYRKCANYQLHGVCNWMVAVAEPHPFCSACRLNRTIPDLSVAGNLDLWRMLETEKRRLIYGLFRLRLPVESGNMRSAALAFDFLADSTVFFSERGRVFTGHKDGLITINIKEADPVVRERLRDEMAEPYRTLLGHFRHESGHYYWDRLIRNSSWLDEYRSLFGDDTLDYGQALEKHYQNGPPGGWQENFISAYAAMHPWEDWAETWAHYLHIVDTLETAWQFSLGTHPQAGDDTQARVCSDFDPYLATSIDALIEHWLPLTFALNSLNRSMGHEHAYPFILSPRVIDKLGFVQRVVRRATSTSR
jgi:hypothetical protein